MISRIVNWLLGIPYTRSPDFIIGDPERPYMLRWWVIPRNKFFNVYLHCFLRDDDDRALHDHPWVWCSWLLRGGYIEHTIAAGGIHYRRMRKTGSVRLCLPSTAHRVELLPDLDAPGRLKWQCWTLFITGPTVREWGFHCPERGWVHWKEFTAPNQKGQIGKGCGA
jgi:hypothetical protein